MMYTFSLAFISSPHFMRVFMTICSLFILCGPTLLGFRYFKNKKQFKRRNFLEEEKLIEELYERNENGEFPWEEKHLEE